MSEGIKHRRLRIQYPSVSNQLLFCISQFASIFAFGTTTHLPHNLPFTTALSRPTRREVGYRASMQILLPVCKPTQWLLSIHKLFLRKENNGDVPAFKQTTQQNCSSPSKPVGWPPVVRQQTLYTSPIWSLLTNRSADLIISSTFESSSTVSAICRTRSSIPNPQRK